MNKIKIKIRVPHYLDWYYGVEISKIRKDLDDLEKMGVSSILIDSYDDGIEIYAYKERLETDEEYERRITLNKVQEESRLKRERELYEKLKLKYESNKS